MATNEKRPNTPRKRSDVVYSQPKSFQRRRFVLHLLTVVAVVLALVLGMAIFFKVKDVKVSGTEKYTAWEVCEASGIQNGDNLLTLNKAKISSKIITQLPYVKSVRISITLPDTVNIHIEELTVFYSVQASDESWWLMAADTKVVEKITESEAAGYTKVVGVRIVDPKPGNKAVAEESAPETDANGETVPVTVYGREKLNIASDILLKLESNGILGKMTSVDVSDIDAMELMRGDRFRVYLGNSDRMNDKILALRAYFDKEGENTSVELDVSFTVSEDGYYYKPWTE